MRYFLTLWLIVSVSAQDFKDSSSKRAKDRYEKTVREANARYVRDLEFAKTLATKRGDLDDALLIKRTIERFTKVDIEGVYTVSYTNNAVRKYTFSGNNVEFLDFRIKMIKIENGFLLDLSKGQLERWTLQADGRFLVEHWNPDRNFTLNKPALLTGRALRTSGIIQGVRRITRQTGK
jgi:hypothetical protein